MHLYNRVHERTDCRIHNGIKKICKWTNSRIYKRIYLMKKSCIKMDDPRLCSAGVPISGTIFKLWFSIKILTVAVSFTYCKFEFSRSSTFHTKFQFSIYIPGFILMPITLNAYCYLKF